MRDKQARPYSEWWAFYLVGTAWAWVRVIVWLVDRRAERQPFMVVVALVGLLVITPLFLAGRVYGQRKRNAFPSLDAPQARRAE